MAGSLVPRAQVEASARAAIDAVCDGQPMPANPYPAGTDAATEWDRLVEWELLANISAGETL